MTRQADTHLKQALLESITVSRGGTRLRSAALVIATLPLVVLLDMTWLLIWLAALVVWNSLLAPWLERRWVLTAIDRDVQLARWLRASMVAFGLSLTQVLQLAAWTHGTAFAAVVATAWALSSATQVFVYYSRDRLLLASGMAPIVLCVLVGPLLWQGLSWQAMASAMFILIALTAGAAFVARSDTLIAQAGEEAAARRSAEAANAAKSRFIASMHHELRTPLNAIIGYSEMLREGAMGDARQMDVADLDRVLAAARLQLMMIGDLLTFSELQDGRLELELHDFDPAALALEAAAALRVAVEANGNTLTLDIHHLGRARSDPAKLRHCLDHLLSNAGKFTRGGAVKFSARRERNELVFVVADTGAGIAPGLQRAIFEPFSQTDHGAGPAAGLGLPITAHIARLLGGAVGVESTEGKGSAFTLRVRANLGETCGTGLWSAAALTS